MTEVLRRPEVAVSGLLAVLVHGILFGVLVVGLSVKKPPPDKLVVELWRELPPVRKPEPPKKAEPPPPPPPPAMELAKPAPVPAEPPRAAPEPPKPAPPPPSKPAKPPEIATRAEDAPAPEAPKADAKVLAKAEADRKLREQKALEERQRLEDRKRLEQAMREEEQRRLAEARQKDLERQRAEEARRKLEEALSEDDRRRVQEAMANRNKVLDDLRALQERSEAERRAELAAIAKAQKDLEDYTQAIREAIRRRINMPPGISGSPQAVFEVKLLRSGTVAAIQMIKSSGLPAYDRAVTKAVDDAQPLPVPEDPELFDQMRSLTLVFRPND